MTTGHDGAEINDRDKSPHVSPLVPLGFIAGVLLAPGRQATLVAGAVALTGRVLMQVLDSRYVRSGGQSANHPAGGIILVVTVVAAITVSYAAKQHFRWPSGWLS